MKPDSKKTPVLPDAEPTTGSTLLPLWLFLLLGVSIWQGSLYLDRHGGGFSPKVYDPYPSTKYVINLIPKSESGLALLKGRKVFETYCQPCHQATGMGLPGQFPPLAGSEWVNAKGADRIIRIVLNGAAGPITVKGQSMNGAMPPWRDTLSDEDIAAVLTFVRGNKDWGNTAAEVKATHVKEIRDATKARATAWSADELLALPDSK